MSKEKKTTQKNKVFTDKILPHHNVQVPFEVISHQELDCYCIAVFAYMKLRYQYFEDTLKSKYCESNTTIANALGISRSKVIDCLHKLESAGFLIKQTRNSAGVSKQDQTNIYIVSDVLRNQKPEVSKTPKEKAYTPITKDYSWLDDPNNDPF